MMTIQEIADNYWTYWDLHCAIMECIDQKRRFSLLMYKEEFYYA